MPWQTALKPSLVSAETFVPLFSSCCFVTGCFFVVVVLFCFPIFEMLKGIAREIEKRTN